MSNLIVVQHFYDVTQLSLARRHLELAGIYTQERDVHTLATFSPLEARSMGGAKLLVAHSDYHEASRLLIEGGFMVYNPTPGSFAWVETLHEWSLLLPGTASLSRELRLVLMGFVLLSLLFSLALAFLLLK